MQTFDPVRRRRAALPARAGALGETLAWVAGLVLAVSAFTDWYAGASVEGPTLAVVGWHTGSLGKVVFFVGVAAVLLVALRAAGFFELPPALPEPLAIAGLGVAATACVVVRAISVPDAFLPLSGRGTGLWISLASAIALTAAGIVRAAEEL